MDKELISQLHEAVTAYRYAAAEATSILRCISVAMDHKDGYVAELRPAIGTAIDGVARMLKGVTDKFDHIDLIDLGDDDEVAP